MARLEKLPVDKIIFDKIHVNRWFIVANPTSGNRNFSKKWKLIQQLLRDKNIDFSFSITQFVKHEIELVQNAVKQGYRNFISVGGDGTLHHVVNAIMLQKRHFYKILVF